MSEGQQGTYDDGVRAGRRGCWVQVGLVPVLVLAACLCAGVYGMVHNQISYTVAPEYFTVLKFRQFGMSGYPDRVGAAFVGFLASWWMGLLLGPPVVLCSGLFPSARLQARRALEAFVVVAVTALVIGVGTLFSGTGAGLYVPEGVTDPLAFRAAGAMHNASYGGGFAGILTGCTYLLVRRFLPMPPISNPREGR